MHTLYLQSLSAVGLKAWVCATVKHSGLVHVPCSVVWCIASGKPFWVSWTLEDSEHARLRSGESLQVSAIYAEHGRLFVIICHGIQCNA